MRLFAVGALLMMTCAIFAQTDVTDKIVNPSFESNLDGWENDGMQPQSNSAFKLKVGNVYCEKWTGVGGKVGNGSIKQIVTKLKAGTYTLKAVAQNIQEDIPTTKQSGVYLIANSEQTAVNVANEYSVSATVWNGELEIGLVLSGASGNYVTVDNFTLTLEEPTSATYTFIHEKMQTLVDEAKSVSKNLDTEEQKELDSACEAVEALILLDTTDDVTEAVIRLKNAIEDYKLSVASDTETVDMTSSIVNPSFEKNGTEGWTVRGMGAQGNSEFKKKSGSTYMEAWTWHGNTIGNVDLYQTVSLPNGSYTLTATAQNIQQGSNNAPCKGAYIFADEYKTEVGAANDYTLDFQVIEGQSKIGFMTRNAGGNWVAADNFRLTYKGRSLDALLQALASRISSAEDLVKQQMNATALSTLSKAIANAKAINSRNGMEAAAIALRESMETAQKSADAYASIMNAIVEVEAFYDASGTGADAFLSAINAAKDCYGDNSNTDEQVAAQEVALRKAMLLYRVENSTGAVPEVTTISFVARGATGALGRSTVKGSDILEKGFCWSTEHNPTILDNRTTNYYDINGPMYLMQPLQPSTVYYVRAYAMTNDYAVGYGEERKVITLPMGNSGYWYNWGGSAEENERINNALADCIYYYNNWSSTTNFTISCSYGSGTPTADCSYGGSMRVGPNASYQRTGTILHESNHGVGIGTSDRWWNTNLHDGEWKGYRANSLLQFIENNPSSKMAGDSMHMWPYGINGASEDSGWAMLYIANVMITQAMHEDGIIPPGHGGCKPAYVFEHEDDTKYYITNESDTYGSGIAYLTESSTGTLSWSESEGSVANNDAYAWYLAFDPVKQLYTIRNAKSGKYFSYSSGIKTVTKSKLSDTEYFHLMVGRDEKVLGSAEYGVKTHSYWIMAGNDVAEPSSLTASTSGKTSATNFNIADGASNQRWFILTADEVDKADNGKIVAYKNNLADLIAEYRKIQQVPYVEKVEGAESNKDFLNILDEMDARKDTENDADVLKQMYDETYEAGMTYLASVSVADFDNPFDLTFLMTNPTLASDASGWSGSVPACSYGCGEFFQTSFEFYQIIKGLPLGTYKFIGQGFQRPGPYTSVYDPYLAGNYTINSYIYMGNKSKKLCHICDEAQSKKIGGLEQAVGSPAVYIPDNMEAAGVYFDKGLYNNEVYYTPASPTLTRVNIRVGVKGTNTASAYWTIFRNFHFYYFGGVDPVGIDSVKDDCTKDEPVGIYDLSGRKLKNIRKGVVIVDGKLKFVK